MYKSNYQWRLPEAVELPTAFQDLVAKRNLSKEIAKILWSRNIRTTEELTRFLDPQLTDFHDPFLMYDMEKVVLRLQDAVAKGEKILIYGDYDADGITSSTVMKEALELLGAEVAVYLPNRFTDGYGPNLAVYEEKIAQGFQLIVTVDNGVSGHEAIDYANSVGVDVIVTDHHELPQELPAAFGIIHPRHPQGNYPFGDLAGVGVAFKVACALLDEVPLEFLDLVAIGTIADMVSLTDENRALVTIGLQMIKQTERIGLQELFKVAACQIMEVDEMMIGFSISPRLNAIGRLKDPNPAVELLTTFDEEQAVVLAKSLNEINEERKALVTTITAEAKALVDPNAPVNVVAKAGWHEGVLGIVAGKLMKETGKPTLVLTIKPDGIAKGSGRSIASLNLFEMLSQMKELFTSFGGHHAAVGLSLPQDSLALLREKIVEYFQENQLEMKAETLLVEDYLPISEITLPFIENLKVLAPFGTDNPLPRFGVKAEKTSQLRQIGANQQHLKLTLLPKEGEGSLDVIGFDFGKYAEEFNGNPFTVVGELSINEWNGNKKPQMQLVDFEVKGLQIFDYRGKKQKRLFQATTETLLLAFQPLTTQQKNSYGEEVVSFSSIEELQALVLQKNYQEVAILDCPQDPELLKGLLQAIEFKRILLILDAEDDAYLDGIGSREQYGRLFKLIAAQKRLDVRNKLPQMAQYLNIPQKLLIFMIQVFFDLKFVTISDGVLESVPNPSKQALETSQLYQARKQKIKSEEFLLLSDPGTLKAWLTSSSQPV